MRKIVEACDIEKTKWDALVMSSSVVSWFQTPEAFRFYSGLSFVESFAFGVNKEDELKGVVVGFVVKDGGRIKSFFSRRAIVNGGLLLADDVTEDDVKSLLNGLKARLKHKSIYIETRNFNDYSRWKNIFEDCGFNYEPHYDIWVDTSSRDVMESNLGKSRKRDVRVSLREGASVIEAPTLDQVREYYAILCDLYKSKIKTPLLGLDFFEKLYALPETVFLLVEYRGKIVGGTVCVGLPGKTLYEMYVCGKDGFFKNIFPSELATYAGLKYAAENGYRCFDMMGAGRPGDGGYGVRDFKLRFGGELVEFGRCVYACKPLLFAVGKLGVKMMKKL